MVYKIIFIQSFDKPSDVDAYSMVPSVNVVFVGVLKSVMACVGS